MWNIKIRLRLALTVELNKAAFSESVKNPVQDGLNILSSSIYCKSNDVIR